MSAKVMRCGVTQRHSAAWLSKGEAQHGLQSKGDAQHSQGLQSKGEAQHSQGLQSKGVAQQRNAEA